MKKNIFSFCIVLCLILNAGSVFSQKNKKDKNKHAFETKIDSISYVIGADIAKNFTKNSIQINPEAFFKGLTEGLEGKDSLVFTKKQADSIINAFQQELMSKQEETNKTMANENKVKGSAFLADNKTKEGVITLPSGLQYKIINEGSGEHPKATDKVKVHYTGKLIDGTVFDSSVERGEPISFPLDRVIKGWTEGVQLMTPGAKYIFYIPSELGYGDYTTGPIPGGSTLIFEVELLNIEK
jgi:FKBP-type peptidyl-prolyl cis-trans isomerase